MLFFSKRKERIRQILAGRKLPVLLACVAMLLVMGTVGTDIYFDDYIHRLKLQNPQLQPGGYGGIMTLFAFGTGRPEQMQQALEYGMVPWWTNKQLKIAFFRPISASTHWLDYHLWPDSPAIMHFHSILWLGVLVFTAALVYRRIMTPLWIAGLAALLFAMDDAHGIPTGWLANRNALVSAVFGLWSLICHDRWRRDGWRAGAAWGPVCFLLGLLSAEAGLAAGAYIVAYELFLVAGKPRRKIMGVVPYFLVFVLWYGIYQIFGFGTEGGGAYIDPGRNPVGYLAALLERMPALLYGQWLFPNAFIYGLLPKPAAYMVLIAVYGLLAGIAVVLWPIIKRDAVARFWALGMVLALLPACATFPNNRLLIFSGLGAMGLLARLLAAWFEKASWLPAARAWKVTARVYVVILIVIHFIVAPLALPNESRGVARMSEVMLERPLLEMSQSNEIYGKTLVFVNPPIPFTMTHVPFVCRKHLIARPAATRILASGLSSDLTITRVDDRSLDIEAEGGFINQSLDRLYRGASHPMAAGQRVELSDMVAEVLTLTEDRRPLKVRFTFSQSLEDPSLCLYQWKETGYIPFDPPAAGKTVHLAKVGMPL